MDFSGAFSWMNVRFLLEGLKVTVEVNEDEFNAIEREIKEEFELEVKACEFLVNNVCEYQSKTIDLRLYFSLKFLRAGALLYITITIRISA